MKLSVIAMISVLVVCFGCKRTTTIDMTKQNEQIGLSEEAKKEIERIVREVVREELAGLDLLRSTSVSDVLEEVKAKNELAQIEEKKKNADQLVMTGLRIASSAQAWLRKPAAFGGPALVGGERPRNFKGVSLTLEQLGYPVEENGSYSTLHGRYELEIIEDSEVLTIYGRNALLNNLVKVHVAGVLVDDISTEIQNIP